MRLTNMKKLRSLIATLLAFSIILSMFSAVSFVSAAGTDIDVATYTQSYSPTNENIKVEFGDASYGFFRLKGNNQHIYIKSITITAESK